MRGRICIIKKDYILPILSYQEEELNKNVTKKSGRDQDLKKKAPAPGLFCPQNRYFMRLQGLEPWTP